MVQCSIYQASSGKLKCQRTTDCIFRYAASLVTIMRYRSRPLAVARTSCVGATPD